MHTEQDIHAIFYSWKVETKDYNVIIDGRNFFESTS